MELWSGQIPPGFVDVIHATAETDVSWNVPAMASATELHVTVQVLKVAILA